MILTFLRAQIAGRITVADMAPLHRAFGIVVRTLRRLERGRSTCLSMLRFDFSPGGGTFDDLESTLKELKREGALGIEWDGESEKVIFYPTLGHAEKHTDRLLEERQKKLPKFNETDTAILENLCQRSVEVYKSLRRSSCD